MNGKIALDTDISIKFLNGDKVIESFLSKRLEGLKSSGLILHSTASTRCRLPLMTKSISLPDLSLQ
jgi:hypothetical protein